MQSKIEGDYRLWTSSAVSVAYLFENKVMFLLTILVICDKPLLSGQPPLSGHLPVPLRVAAQ